MTQSLVTNRKSFLLQIIPVMLCFFVMGFVDLVGTASNYVQKDLGLSDSQANLFPSLVFFWFLIFSVPTGMLMNRIGRKKTVLVSLAVTAASLFIPLFGDSYAVMLVSFSLLGIGNAIMQTSPQSPRDKSYQRRQTCINAYLRSVCEGDSFVSRAGHCRMGRHYCVSDFRTRLESAVCDLCGSWISFDLAACRHTHR